MASTTPICVLTKYKTLVNAFSANQIPPSTAQYAVIDHVSGRYIVNCLTIRTIYPTVPTTSWTAFVGALTNGMVANSLASEIVCPRHIDVLLDDGRHILQLSSYGNKRVYPKKHTLNNSTYLSVAYGHPDHYGDENNPANKAILTDLVIRQDTPQNPRISLQNCLVFVNGYMARGTYTEDNDDPRLYVNVGAKLVAGSNVAEHEIILWDMSPIGDLTSYKNLHPMYVTASNKVVLAIVMTDTIPTTVTRGLCIGGTLFMEESADPTYPSGNIMVVPITNDFRDNMVASYNRAIRNAPTNSSIFVPPADLSEFISWLDNALINTFMFTIDNPNVCTARTPSLGKLTDNVLRFPPGSDGLLRNNNTLRAFQHFSETYDAVTHVSFIPSDLNRIKTLASDNLIGSVGTLGGPSWCTQVHPANGDNYHLYEIFAPDV